MTIRKRMGIVAAAIVALGANAAEDYTRYVDARIGTEFNGHTTVAAAWPLGMVQAGPDTGRSKWDYCSGYRGGDRAIWGFSQTHLSGTGGSDLGDLRLQPGGEDRSWPFDKKNETAHPGEYAVQLDGVDVAVAIAATPHGAIYRFTYLKDGPAELLVDTQWGVAGNRDRYVEASEMKLDGAKGTAAGWRRTKCWVRRTVHYRLETDHAWTWKELPPKNKDERGRRYVLTFADVHKGDTVTLKLALSATSQEAAAHNLAAEIPAWDFEKARADAKAAWNAILGTMAAKGTPDELTNFYTSVYHLYFQPNDIGDAGGTPRYSTFSCWDTFRAAGPLYTLLTPDLAAAFVDSMLRQGKDTGYLPIWTLWGVENQCMIGTHSVPMIVDAYLKGVWKGDATAAFAQIRDTLTQKHDGRGKENWDVYDQYGYYPIDRIRTESVSRTMECAYDDWCAAQMARRLGLKDDAERFGRRAGYWRNVFDPSVGLARGRDSNGKWREPFNPFANGHGKDKTKDFTEGNAWQYTWHVLQDPEGLVAAFGGKDAFVRQLDRLFTLPTETEDGSRLQDVTGLIGQYAHGNEPSHHVVYFYQYVDRPERTAELVREIFDRFYLPKPDGLCGNDDCGQMSAWYLFSAMGFYPFNPCGGDYVLGAPQLPEVTLCLANGKRFTVRANNLSKANKYVKSVTLNGQPMKGFILRHADIVAGGELVFEMTDHRNDRAWADSEWIAVKDAPVKSDEDKTERAADGTSRFFRLVRNAQAVRKATWLTTGLGVYELSVNGEAVGAEDALKPGFTHAKKTRRSFAYDVTDRIRKEAGAENLFAAGVSAGWWRDKIVNYHGKRSAFRCVIELTYADGTVERIGTKAAEWSGAVGGPVRHAGIFDGEEYDARVPEVVPEPGRGPYGCEPSDEFAGEILPSEGGEVRRREDLALSPVEAYVWRGTEGGNEAAGKDRVFGRVNRLRTCKVGKDGLLNVRLVPDETLVVDFGQNAAAVPVFTFRADEGTTLTCLPGEMLNDANGEVSRGNDGPAGSVYRANLRIPADGMRAVYTFGRGGRSVTYGPRFTFFGYRYVSVTVTAPTTIERLVSVPVTSIARADELGRIETGDKDVNRLIANVYWGQLSNYLSVPTDCPQRNERLGWTADTQVFAEAGTYNANTRDFFHKWMRDLVDSQADDGGFPSVAPRAQYGNAMMRLGWADAGIIVPYQIWRQFGDTRIVNGNWSAMERYMDRLATMRLDKFQYADWLSYEDLESASGRGWETRNGKRVLREETQRYWDYLGACYWLWDSQMMAEMARAFGRDEAKYVQMIAAARRRLLERHFDAATGLLKAPFDTMQTPALFAIKLGLVEGDARTKTIAALRKNFADHGNCLQTGFLGTSILMDTLTANGMVDVAYELLLQHKDPSWLYSVDQGATTIWERWNSYTKERGFGPVSMNSFNHYAYGAVLAWIYKTAAGIAPAEPGFRVISMAPVPDRRLGHVTAEYRSAAGLIRSAWRYEGDRWIWEFTVPAGARARVCVPGETAVRDYPAGDYRIVRDPRTIRVGTYNIRTPADSGENEWNARKGDMLRLIGDMDMDVFGLQEVTPGQAKEIDAALSGYGREGVYRNRDRASGEATPVYFRKDRFERLDGGTFWLSEEPEEPGSRSWDSACVRICTWVRLKDRRGGKELVFVNTHLDHRSEQARIEGVKLILSRMARMAPKGTPVVFVGDHNCREDSEPERIIALQLGNALRLTQSTPSGSWRTLNGWKAHDRELFVADVLANPWIGSNREKRIDHIWVSEGVEVTDCVTRCDFRPGTRLYPSDHFPVFADIVP